MEPLAIVEDFDVVEQGRLGLDSGLELRFMDQFGFQRAEITLHGRDIEAVAFAAHRLNKTVGLEDAAIGLRSVLDPTVRMSNQPWLRMLGLDGHHQGILAD